VVRSPGASVGVAAMRFWDGNEDVCAWSMAGVVGCWVEKALFALPSVSLSRTLSKLSQQLSTPAPWNQEFENTRLGFLEGREQDDVPLDGTSCGTSRGWVIGGHVVDFVNGERWRRVGMGMEVWNEKRIGRLVCEDRLWFI
jgi:hypothetical protein